MSGRQAKKGEYSRVRRILVSIIHNLGDAVMATAALELVRRRFPEAAIDVLARQGVGELFAGHPLVRRAYSYDARTENTYRYFLSWMLPNRYDLLVSFDRKSMPAICARLSGVRWRVAPTTAIGDSRPKKRSSILYNHLIPVAYEESYPALEAFQKLVRRAFGIEEQGWINIPNPSAENLEKARQLLPAGRKPVIGFSVRAERSAKNWPPERFAELMRRLRNETGAFIYVTGTRGDSEHVENLLGMAGPEVARNLAGQTDILDVVALMQASDLFITLDTGAMHLAGNSGLRRIIGLFCCTSPGSVAGAIPDVSVIWSGLDEHAPDAYPEELARSGERIPVDAVYTEALRLLSEEQAPPGFMACRDSGVRARS